MADLKAGRMGPKDDVGMPSAFAGSMAAAIETALNEFLSAEERETLEIFNNTPESRERRLVFCAIAQGVVRHLRANADAFRVHLEFSGDFVTGATIEIRTQ